MTHLYGQNAPSKNLQKNRLNNLILLSPPHQTTAILLKGDDQMKLARFSGLAIKTAVLHNPRAV